MRWNKFNLFLGVLCMMGMNLPSISQPINNAELFGSSYSSCEMALPMLQDAINYKASGEDMPSSKFLTLMFYEQASMAYPEQLRVLHKGQITTAFEVADDIDTPVDDTALIFMEKCVNRTKSLIGMIEDSENSGVCGMLNNKAGLANNSISGANVNFWRQVCESVR